MKIRLFSIENWVRLTIICQKIDFVYKLCYNSERNKSVTIVTKMNKMKQTCNKNNNKMKQTRYGGFYEFK